MPYNSPLVQVPLPSAADPANVPSDLQNAFYRMEKYGIITCTSTTRPSSPHAGMTIYETDTRKIYMYVGTTWLHHNPVVNCTSTTRPVSPFTGMMIYETNTGNNYIYYGSTTGWRPPWNQPWGVVTSATKTTNTTFSSTVAANVSGMTVSWASVASRRYKITFDGQGTGSVNSGFLAALRITDGGGGIQQMRYKDVRNTADQFPISMSFLYTVLASGSSSMTLQGWSAVASCSWILSASSIQPTYLMVEDIGSSVSAPSS